jgi:hypothetical protein
MAEPFNVAYKVRVVQIVIGVLITAVIGGLGLVGLQFVSYAGSGGIPDTQTNAQVAISSPIYGTQLETGESMMVELMAIGSIPFQRLELWINGGLFGVQTAPDEGVHPFSTYFLWQPLEPGIYSLAAIAFDINGNQAISEQVLVIVEDSETVETLVSVVSPPQLPGSADGGYGPPTEPPSTADSGPANLWSPTIGGWITSLTAEQKPAAPELAARVGECTARLHIHDLSDNEEGFIVYRQTGISPMWTQVAALTSQTEFDWLTYEDQGIYGPVTYYVTAFNSQGQSASNIAFVNIDPDGCVTESSRASQAKLGLALRIPNLSADLVYCYISNDGINWSRWPQTGFLLPTGGSVQTEIVSLNLTGDQPGEEQAAPSLNIFMDCWGWAGGALQHLGNAAKEGINPQTGDGLQIQGEGIHAELIIGNKMMAGQSDLYPVGNKLAQLSEYLGNLGVVDGVSPQIPRVNLTFTLDKETCGDHLPPDAQNLVGQLLYCFPYPAYDLDKGASSPQPYLIWGFDFEPVCIGGVSEQCLSYWELLNMAEETGGQVGFTVLAVTGASQKVWNVTEPNLTMFVVPPIACLGSTDFSVRLWYRPGNQGVGVSASPEQNVYEVGEFEFTPQEILYGPYSNVVKLPCNSSNMLSPSVIEYYKEIRVNFSDLSFFHLDDGGGEDYVISSDNTVELYGYFRIMAPSLGHWQVDYCFMPSAEMCDNEPYWTGTRRYLLIADWEEDESINLKHVAGSVINNAYKDLQYWEMCLAGSKHSCKFEGQSTPSEMYNNTITAIIKEGDVLTIEMRLVDYDELSADDEVCVGNLMIPTEEFINGGLSDPYGFQIFGKTTDSGECILSGSITPVKWITYP